MAIVHENYDFFTMNTIDLTPLSLMINGRENYFLFSRKGGRRLKVGPDQAGIEQRFSPLSLVPNLGSFKMNPGENLNLSSYF